MRYVLVALSLLLGACSYKSVLLEVPTPSMNSNTTLDIQLIQPFDPIVGRIGKEAKIKLARDIGGYLRAKILQKADRFKDFHIEIRIDRIYLVYEPRRASNNLAGVVEVFVRLQKRGVLVQRRIVVKGVEALVGLG